MPPVPVQTGSNHAQVPSGKDVGSQLSKEGLSTDLNLLSTLPSSSIRALIDPDRPTTSETASAVDALDRYSIGNATEDDTQRLIDAYVRDMTRVGSTAEAAGEDMGGRIDRLRERAEEIQQAVSEVKV